METTRSQHYDTDRSLPSKPFAHSRVVIRSRFRKPDWVALLCWLTSFRLDD